MRCLHNPNNPMPLLYHQPSAWHSTPQASHISASPKRCVHETDASLAVLSLNRTLWVRVESQQDRPPTALSAFRLVLSVLTSCRPYYYHVLCGGRGGFSPNATKLIEMETVVYSLLVAGGRIGCDISLLSKSVLSLHFWAT